MQGWLLSVPLLLDKRNRECSMDFEDIKAFVQLLKKVRSMRNNHFAFTSEHLSSKRSRHLRPRDLVIRNKCTADFEKTDNVHMKASIMQIEGYLQDITGKIIFILYLCIHWWNNDVIFSYVVIPDYSSILSILRGSKIWSICLFYRCVCWFKPKKMMLNDKKSKRLILCLWCFVLGVYVIVHVYYTVFNFNVYYSIFF